MDLNLITLLTLSYPSGSITFDNQNYIMTSIKGFEMPLLRIPRYNLPAQSGAQVSNFLYGERAISIAGVVNAPDNTPQNQKIITYLNNRLALINALSIYRDVYGNLDPQTLTVTLANNVSFSCYVYQDKPLQMGFSEGIVDYETFQITLVAPDPNLYSTVQNSTNLGLAMGGGVAVPVSNPANPHGTATSATSTTLTDTTQSWTTNQFVNGRIYITAGTDSGDSQIILSNTSNTITINGTFLTTPTPSSTYTIGYYVLSLGATSGGSTIITNTGANEAFPTVTLTGPLTNPFIANITTNQYTQLNMTIASGSSVVINMANQTVTQGGADVSANLTSGSTYWGLFLGGNNIAFSASSGSGTSSISFYPSYAGV